MEPVSEETAAKPATRPELDFAKLLGFRNLPAITTPGREWLAGSDAAFTKRGTETAFA